MTTDNSHLTRSVHTYPTNRFFHQFSPILPFSPPSPISPVSPISSARNFCNIPDYIDGMVMDKYIAIVCHPHPTKINWLCGSGYTIPSKYSGRGAKKSGRRFISINPLSICIYFRGDLWRNFKLIKVKSSMDVEAEDHLKLFIIRV